MSLSRRGVFVLVAAFSGFTINAWVSLRVRSPEPAIHDEFSYLLAADTFAQGRLTNPTHPLWRHFESFHIIHEPSYQSKYPPGQAMVLALGQGVGGHPRVGLWLSMAAAAAALCWMLQGWIPSRWAFAGVLVWLLHPKFTAWWGQTYWGGAVAMTGGALVFGAVPRLCRPRPRAVDAVALACGMVVLAWTRPFEGIVAGIPALAVVANAVRAAPDRREAVARVVAPIALIGAVGIAWLGYYNYRVTGDVFKLPYTVWADTYQSAGAVLRHQELIRYRGSAELGIVDELVRLASLYWMSIFWLPLLALPETLRSRRFRLALLVACIVVGVSVVVSKGWPHYSAPITCLVIALAARGLAVVYHTRVAGVSLRPLVVVFFCAQLVIMTRYFAEPPGALWSPSWHLDRVGVEQSLRSKPGKHLVVVRYAPDHNVHREWVYNRADIDASRVVWAREMDPGADHRLLDYFKDRTAWLVFADEDPPRFVRYETADEAQGMPARAVTSPR